MIDNIHNRQASPMMGTSNSPHADAANRRLSEPSDATIQVDFADLMDRAARTTQADAHAVEKARELLLSGRLTSPENIRSAAESILTFGI